MLRVIDAEEGPQVELPAAAAHICAGLWGSILAMVAEVVAREHAARGDGAVAEILSQIQRGFTAELHAMLAPDHALH